jgi:hypothetical protein
MLTDKEAIKIVKQLGMMPVLYKMTKITYGIKYPLFHLEIQKYGGIYKWMMSRLTTSEDGLIKTLDEWDKVTKSVK